MLLSVKNEGFIDKYILNPFIFKVLMVVVTLFTAIPYVHMLIGGYVKFILAYGLLICAWMLITGKFKPAFKDKTNWLLIAFFVSYAVTIIINRQYDFKSNVSELLYMAVFFFLFCFANINSKAVTMEKEIRVLSWIFISITFTFSCVSLYMYLTNLSGSYYNADSSMQYFYGMFQNRLWGLYNPNTGAAINALSILFSICAFKFNKGQRDLSIALILINAIVQYLCFVLAASRGAYFSLLVAVTFAILIVALKRITLKSKIKKSIILVCVLVITIGAYYGIYVVTQNLVSYLPSVVKSSFTVEQQVADVYKVPTSMNISLEKENIARPDSSADVSSGRFSLWESGLKTFLNSPIFGTSREGLDENVLIAGVNSSEASSLQDGGLHNIYITILVSSGVVGFVLILTYLLFEIVKFMISILKQKGLNKYSLCSLSILLFMLVGELVESRILYRVELLNVIFWMILGYNNAFANREIEVKSNG